ncbi:unnamed protein product, partial [Symbiodinium microadriaticum]
MAAGAATAAAAASQAAAAVLSTTEAFRRTDLLRTLVQKPDVYKPTTMADDTKRRARELYSEPSSRQRQLALVAQLSTVRFDPAKSLSEQ